MLFQVKKDGKVMFWTTEESCVPSEEDIKSMKRAGYKVKKVGDKVDPEKN